MQGLVARPISDAEREVIQAAIALQRSGWLTSPRIAGCDESSQLDRVVIRLVREYETLSPSPAL